MNNLVFIQNDRVVTDSLIVAETFGKTHDKVLRDIREIGCSYEFRLSNFGESSYTNLQGREMPKYLITQDGFTLLAMGYTGKKAMEFKENYIKAFRKMEEELKLKPKILSEREQLIASMKITLETAQELDGVKEEVKEIRGMVEEQITLDHKQQRDVQKAVSTRVYKFANNPKEVRRLYGELYRELKDRFGVASYRDIKKKDILLAVNYIEAWIPKKTA